MGLHYLDSLASVPTAEKFISVLKGEKSEAAQSLYHWYRTLADSQGGISDISRFLKDLSALGALGGEPLDRMYQELKRRISYRNPQLFTGARLLAAGLDSRTNHRAVLSKWGAMLLSDFHKKYPISNTNWRYVVGKDFMEVFLDKPKEEALTAFQAINLQNIEPWHLLSLETGNEKLGEYHWSYKTLSSWQQKGISLKHLASMNQKQLLQASP